MRHDEGRPPEENRPAHHTSNTSIPLAPLQGPERLEWVVQHNTVIAIDVSNEIDKMVRQGWDAGDAADACRGWWQYQVDQWVIDGITRYLARRWSS